MKYLLLRVAGWLGRHIPHRYRRFLLDRMRLGRLAIRMATDEAAELSVPGRDAIFVNPLLHSHLMEGGLGDYDAEIDLVLQLLRPGDTFYDVGANVGLFSFPAARHVGSEGSVYAFEPEENNLACFRRTLDRWAFGNVVLYQVAIGAADGRASFDRRGGAFSGRVLEGGRSPAGSAILVEMRSIDSLVEDGARPPTVLKIDIEGGEGAALEGAMETLAQHWPTVLCELHPDHPTGIVRTLAALEASGYECRTLNGQRLVGVPTERMHVVASPVQGRPP